MADSDQKTQQDDEVVLRLPTPKFWRRVVAIVIIGLAVLFCDRACRLLSRGDYLDGLIAGTAGLGFLTIGVGGLVARHILFYRDKVVQFWYLFGQRTFPYTRAKLVVHPDWLRAAMWPCYPAKGKPEPFRIYETDGKGRVRRVQIPINYDPDHVPPDMREKVETIIGYLVGVEDKSKLYEESRVFAKSTLPKDILGQDQDQGKTYNSWLGLKL